MMDSNGGPEGRMDSLNSDYWGGLRQAASQIKDKRRRRLAVSIFESESVEEVAEKVDKIERGTWFDNLMLGGSAIAGVVLGYKLQELIDIRARGVPVTGLLGLGGVVPGLAMESTLTARNVVGLGGLLFLTGAGLYTSTHAIDEPIDEVKVEESEEA